MVEILSATCILFNNSPEVREALEKLFGEIMIDDADPSDAILIVCDVEVREGETIGLLEDGTVFRLDFGG